MPEDVPMVCYWRGKRLEEMTREELIGAVRELGNTLNSTREQWEEERKMRTLFRRVVERMAHHG